MTETLITTTIDLFNAATGAPVVPEGTTMRVVSDEIDYVIAETLDGETCTGLNPNEFTYNQRDPGEMFRR